VLNPKEKEDPETPQKPRSLVGSSRKEDWKRDVVLGCEDLEGQRGLVLSEGFYWRVIERRIRKREKNESK